MLDMMPSDRSIADALTDHGFAHVPAPGLQQLAGWAPGGSVRATAPLVRIGGLAASTRR